MTWPGRRRAGTGWGLRRRWLLQRELLRLWPLGVQPRRRSIDQTWEKFTNIIFWLPPADQDGDEKGCEEEAGVHDTQNWLRYVKSFFSMIPGLIWEPVAPFPEASIGNKGAWTLWWQTASSDPFHWWQKIVDNGSDWKGSHDSPAHVEDGQGGDHQDLLHLHFLRLIKT